MSSNARHSEDKMKKRSRASERELKTDRAQAVLTPAFWTR